MMWKKPIIFEAPLIKDLKDVTTLCCVIGGCSGGYSRL